MPRRRGHKGFPAGGAKEQPAAQDHKAATLTFSTTSASLVVYCRTSEVSLGKKESQVKSIHLENT